MPVTKHWTVDIDLSEETGDGTAITHAEAHLHTANGDDHRGEGHARKHPDDTDVPEIGDELAVARALSDLAHHVLDTAAEDIEAVTHEPVRNLAE